MGDGRWGGSRARGTSVVNEKIWNKKLKLNKKRYIFTVRLRNNTKSQKYPPGTEYMY